MAPRNSTVPLLIAIVQLLHYSSNGVVFNGKMGSLERVVAACLTAFKAAGDCGKNCRVLAVLVYAGAFYYSWNNDCSRPDR